MSSPPREGGGGGGTMLHTSPSGNHVTASAAAAASDREVVTSDRDQERMGAVLVAITDKLDALEKSARDKRALLESAGVSSAKSAMRDMESAQARDEMAKSASKLLQTKSNFESLRKALVLAQNAEVMAAGLDKRDDAPVQLDQEEINHLKDMLAVQKKLALDILELEDSRVASQLQLLESMERRAKEFSFEDDDMEDILGEKGNKAKDPASLQNKRDVLKAEEARLNQMKFMVQKLLLSLPKDTFDEATEKRYADFAVRCGRDVEELQEEHMK